MSMAQAREQMIEQQVRAWDVLDARVLETLRQVPREAFVPSQHRFLAFADVEIPLPCGQHMLRPSVVGRLLQALALTRRRAGARGRDGLGIRDGLPTGGRRIRPLAGDLPRARGARARNVASLGLRDVDIVAQDATQLDSDARYDAIAITASLPTPR